MKKTILVTGGAGFIGSNFVYLLLDERPEWKVVCVDALTYAANIHTLNKAFENPNFVFYKEDIRNREGIFKIFEKVWGRCNVCCCNCCHCIGGDI